MHNLFPLLFVSKFIFILNSLGNLNFKSIDFFIFIWYEIILWTFTFTYKFCARGIWFFDVWYYFYHWDSYIWVVVHKFAKTNLTFIFTYFIYFWKLIYRCFSIDNNVCLATKAIDVFKALITRFIFETFRKMIELIVNFINIKNGIWLWSFIIIRFCFYASNGTVID